MKTVINLQLSKWHKKENWRECRPQCLSVSPSSRSLTPGSMKVIWQHSRFVKIWHRMEERFPTSILIKKYISLSLKLCPEKTLWTWPRGYNYILVIITAVLDRDGKMQKGILILIKIQLGATECSLIYFTAKRFCSKIKQTAFCCT